MQTIYPYLPKGRTILHVSSNNPFLKEAARVKKTSPCLKRPSGAVVVKGGKIIGRGKNARKKVEVCPRIQGGYKTGEGYHLCKEICGQEAHTEIAAIRDAQGHGFDVQNADLYLDGHWCCCKNCWDTMIKVGIRNVYVKKDAHWFYRTID